MDRGREGGERENVRRERRERDVCGMHVAFMCCGVVALRGVYVCHVCMCACAWYFELCH